jgi:hypothetical protein
MILERLNVSRIIFENLDCFRGTLILVSLKDVVDALLDQTSKLLISLNSRFNHQKQLLLPNAS